MCDPLSAMAAATAVSAGASIYQGQEEKKQLKEHAAMRRREAEQIREVGLMEEAMVNRRNKILMSRQRLALIDADIDPTTGTALDLAYDTAQNAERERMAIRAGADFNAQSREHDARLLRRKAKSAEIGSFFDAGVSLLRGGSKMAALA